MDTDFPTPSNVTHLKKRKLASLAIGALPAFKVQAGKSEKAVDYKTWINNWLILNPEITFDIYGYKLNNTDLSVDILSNEIRGRAAQFDVNFNLSDLKNELLHHIEVQQIDLTNEIKTHLCSNKKEFDWSVIDGLFTDQKLAIAGLSQLIWLVKRRLSSLNTFDDIMVNIFSDKSVNQRSQGTGKSAFWDYFASPLQTLYTPGGSVELISDSRRIASLNSKWFVRFDELHSFDKADTAKVKQIITNRSLDYGVMGTNKMAAVKNNAVFVGTSNPTIAELYRDTSGMRRFIELEITPPENLINRLNLYTQIDWTSLWQSVDHLGPSPYSLNRNIIEDHQESLTAKHPVQNFIDYCLDGSDPDQKIYISTSSLMSFYNSWASSCSVFKKYSSSSWFAKDFKRLSGFKIKKTKKCNAFELPYTNKLRFDIDMNQTDLVDELSEDENV